MRPASRKEPPWCSHQHMGAQIRRVFRQTRRLKAHQLPPDGAASATFPSICSSGGDIHRKFTAPENLSIL